MDLAKTLTPWERYSPAWQKELKYVICSHGRESVDEKVP